MHSVQDISRDLLASEARNLHAIQKNAKSMMLKVIDRLDSYPDAKARLQAHLGDKDNEMHRLEQILSDLGEDASGAKDGVMSMMGAMTGLMTGGLEDDILKTSMATYGLANYEICAYEGMIQLAEKADLPAAVPLLQECLQEERAMADWLHEHMSPTLDRYLELRTQDGRAAAAH
jgi:ferritin-like metal-binding protein YciE